MHPINRRTRIALLFLVVAALFGGTTSAASAGRPAVPTPIDKDRFSLHYDPVPRKVLAERENAMVAQLVPFTAISYDRTTRDCPPRARRAAKPLIERDGHTLLRCWDQGDSRSRWRPQGITSTADADPTGLYEGMQAFAVTSYRQTGKGQQARVSLLPQSARAGYRHINLVNAMPGGASRSVDCHAGGTAWYGPYLLVACTSRIMVFDWRKVYRTSNGTLEMLKVGELDSRRGVRFSTLSLDRSSGTPVLVVSEYDIDCSAGACRVIRFALPASPEGLPAHGGPLRALDAFRHSYDSVQGVTARGNTFWFASSNGKAENGPISDHYGKLHVWTAGTDVDRHYRWAYGAESIAFSTPNAIATVTEWGRTRIIAQVSATSFP